MKAITAIALLTGAAVVTAATVAIVLKKRADKNQFHYDAGDLEDDCCTCEVCGEDLDLESLSEEFDDADTAEASAPAEDEVVEADAELEDENEIDPI